MNVIQKWEAYGETHHPAWLDSLRIVLGLIILIKGFIFISDTGALVDLMQSSGWPWATMAVAHYVAFAHLVGGILIILGLKTRVAILFQLPILLGAIFLVNVHRGYFTSNGELLLSILVLALLIFFFFWGSGPYSVDNWMRTHKER
jgi:putative oxidoreductase